MWVLSRSRLTVSQRIAPPGSLTWNFSTLLDRIPAHLQCEVAYWWHEVHFDAEQLTVCTYGAFSYRWSPHSGEEETVFVPYNDRAITDEWIDWTVHSIYMVHLKARWIRAKEKIDSALKVKVRKTETSLEALRCFQTQLPCQRQNPATYPTQVTPTSGGTSAVHDAGDPDSREVLSDPFVVLTVWVVVCFTLSVSQTFCEAAIAENSLLALWSTYKCT